MQILNKYIFYYQKKKICRNRKLLMCDVTVHNKAWNEDVLYDSCDEDLDKYCVWKRTKTEYMAFWITNI